jgi:hypothetical protein
VGRGAPLGCGGPLARGMGALGLVGEPGPVHREGVEPRVGKRAYLHSHVEEVDCKVQV